MARKRRNKHNNNNNINWYRADLHLHTPASADYEEPKLTYLDILQKAESCNLDI